MKFLFVTKDWKYGIEKNTVYLSSALKKLTDYMEWHEDGDLYEIVQQLPERPDFILLNDMRATRCPQITGIRRVDIPLGIIMHDLAYQPERRKAFIEDNNIRHLFVHYRQYFLQYYAEFSDRMVWFPHWVNTQVFKDYGLEKSHEYLLMGCVEESVYPLRTRILQHMQHLPGFVYHAHPGYEAGRYSEDEFVVGQRYAREINRAKLFLTDNSKFEYMLMKYFEVPACNTLLLAPDSEDGRALGFLPSVHFIAIDENNFYERALYYAQNFDAEGRMIAKRGYEMIRALHSVEKRAQQLIAAVSKIRKERA